MLIEMLLGQSQDVYITHSKDGLQRPLTDAAIQVQCLRSPDDQAPVFTKSIGSGVTLSLDEMAATCVIAPNDIYVRSKYMLRIKISFGDPPSEVHMVEHRLHVS